MGVIGIADGISVTNAADSFTEICKRYPSTLVTRCLLFNPPEKLISIPAVFCVPNVGQISDHLASAMTVFTTEILRAFSILVKQIESRPVISGPTPPKYHAGSLSNSSSANFPHGSTNSLASAIADSITQSPAIVAASAAAAERNKKRTPARALKLTTDIFLMAGRLDIALQSYQTCIELMKQNGDFLWWAAALESYQAAILLHLLNKSGIGPLSNQSTQSENLQPISVIHHQPTAKFILNSPVLLTSLPLRTFLAETSDRHRLILQIYERANAAASIGVGGSAIPFLPVSVCLRMARMLREMNRFSFSEYLVNGAGLSFTLFSSSNLIVGEDGGGEKSMAGTSIGVGGGGSSTPTSVGKSAYPPTAGPGRTAGSPNSVQTEANASTNPGSSNEIVFNNGIGVSKIDVNSWLVKACQILLQNIEFLALSDRVWAFANIAAVYGSIGFRRKHAFFLRQMNLAVAGTLRPSGFNGLAAVVSASKSGKLSSIEDGIRMIDAWKRESTINLEEGELKSSMKFVTEQDSVTGKVDTVENNIAFGLDELLGRSPPNGVIQCYKRVCEVLGLQIRAYRTRVSLSGFLQPTFSDDEEEWLDEFDNDSDLKADATRKTSSAAETPLDIANSRVRTVSLKNLAAMAAGLSKPAAKKVLRLRYGWPALQIQVLKECIQVAEVVDDNPYAIYFIIRLLRRLKRHLPPADQHDLADHLEAVMLKTVAASAHLDQPVNLSESTRKVLEHNMGNNSKIIPVMVRGIAGGVAGIPILRKLEVVGQPQRLVPLTHPVSWLSTSSDAKIVPKELFLFNPTAIKGRKEKISLVANELIYVDLVMANPFAFELDLKSVILTTSGIAFKSHTVATAIPPLSRNHSVRVFGIPLESGTLNIHGVTIKMFGGCLEEEIYPIQKALDDPKRKTKDGKRKKQDDISRFGKIPVHFGIGNPSEHVKVLGPDRSWAISMEVIPAQPLLNVVKGPGITLGAIMVYEGERSRFTLELENIGTIPINYFRVSFVENIDSEDSLPSDAIERLEDVYERDVYNYHLRALWLENVNGDSNSIGRGASYFARIASPKTLEKIELNLQPGGIATVHIGVFGKPKCSGGIIVFEYGNVDYSLDDPASLFYARQVLVPVMLTVTKPVAIHNISVFHVNNREAAVHVEDQEISRAMSLEDLVVDYSELSYELPDPSSNNLKSGRRLNSNHFLLSLDLQNVLGIPFDMAKLTHSLLQLLPRICILVQQKGEPNFIVFSFSGPNLDKRVILPIKRVFLEKSQTQKPIPLPTWKQFVVGRSEKLNYSEDRLRRLAFWLREALVGLGVGGSPLTNPETGEYESDLVCGGSSVDGIVGSYGRVVVRWSCGRGRVGRLLGMRELNLVGETMIDAVIQEEVSFIAQVGGWEGVVVNSALQSMPKMFDSELTLQDGRYKIKVNEFVAVNWNLVNNRHEPIALCFRVQPIFGLLDSLHFDNNAVDTSCKGRVIYSGTLESPIPSLLHPCGGSASHCVPFMFLSRGVYTLIAHAEEVGRIGDPQNMPTKKSKRDKEIDAVALGLVGSAGSIFWARDVLIFEVV
ncbi:hypothetical protein HK100_007787 [Physocladia obscura]|uniref:Uncharacterized protein n=1 Tax=Physocladia obscura TaxID=109957 RepID=A0AAD5XMJ2_9FUNG|nr:hypothetical protein HK100_007787 [Physocladia obscura]